VIFLAAFGTYLSGAYHGGRFYDPPDPGDARDYEAIAFNLWKGRGFGYYWSDPEWQAPYRVSPRYQRAIGRESDFYLTTYRPPAFPFLLAGIYTVAGRNFPAWRTLNCVFAAGAVTLAAAVAAHAAGLVAAPVAALLILQSGELTHFTRVFMTEILATFLVALLAWLWVRGSTRPVSARAAAVSGIVLGLLVLTRSIFVLWMPIALLLPGRTDPAAPRLAWRARGICVLACLLTVAPWWTRNVVVTGALLPMGSQGPINLPAGFGPRALKYEGLWRSNPDDGAPELIAQNLNPYSLEYEVRLAKHRGALTAAWMRDHPVDVVRLMGLHIWQEVRPKGALAWDLLLPAAIAALVFFRKTPGAGVLALIVCASLVSVAMTWGEGGRFILPIQPLLIALVAAMLVALVRIGALAIRGVWPYGAPA
jgi:hypothetical protein